MVGTTRTVLLPTIVAIVLRVLRRPYLESVTKMPTFLSKMVVALVEHVPEPQSDRVGNAIQITASGASLAVRRVADNDLP